MQDFGDLIRLTREVRNVRAYDLAYALGQNPSWVSRLEAGALTHPPSPSVMTALSEQLGLSMAEMFTAMGYPMGLVPSPLPDDPKERLIQEIRRTPMPDHYAVGLIRMLEAW